MHGSTAYDIILVKAYRSTRVVKHEVLPCLLGGDVAAAAVCITTTGTLRISRELRHWLGGRNKQ